LPKVRLYNLLLEWSDSDALVRGLFIPVFKVTNGAGLASTDSE